MKKFLLSASALWTAAALIAGSATAADMGVRPITKGPIVGCVNPFHGWYVGINGGALSWTGHRTDQDGFVTAFPSNGGILAPLATGGTFVQQAYGGMVGGQIGYNWTSCHALFGIEFDGDWTRATRTTDINLTVPFFNSPNLIETGASGAEAQFAQLQSDVKALMTLRARAGVVMDNLLIYATAGVAAARFHTNWSAGLTSGIALGLISGLNAPLAATFDYTEWRWGLVGGVGAEYALGLSNWTIKGEVLYAAFASKDHSTVVAGFDAIPEAAFVGAGAPRTFRFQDSDNIWMTKIGLNYKLGY